MNLDYLEGDLTPFFLVMERRGPTFPAGFWGRKRSPWLLTIDKSWDDPPSIHQFSSVEGPNKSRLMKFNLLTYSMTPHLKPEIQFPKYLLW